MSSINLQDLAIPDDEVSTHAADAAAMLASYLRLHPSPSGRLVLCVDDSPDTKVTVPAQAFKLFIEVPSVPTSSETVCADKLIN